MKIKKVLVLLLGILLCTLTIGCVFIEGAISKANKDKVICKLNTKNATQVSYKGTTYEILDSSIDRSELGGWVGNICRFVVLDNNYCILQQKSIDVSISDIIKNVPEDAKFIVSFQNVYSIKGIKDKDAIAVHINSNFYKAVPVGTKTSNEVVIKYEKENRLDKVSDKSS